MQSIGALDLAESFIQTIEDEVDRKVALIEYEADTWEINNPFVVQMWESLGGTQESLVEAFRVAVTL